MVTKYPETYKFRKKTAVMVLRGVILFYKITLNMIKFRRNVY